MSELIYKLQFALPIIFIGFVITYFLTPVMKRIAFKGNLLDHPTPRKIHTTPIARLGGVAIYCGFMGAILSNVTLDKPLIGILVGAYVIFTVGLLDDIFSLNPYYKLIGQFFAALVPILFGIQIDFISNPFGGMIPLGWITVPLTLLWIMGMINALNLIDGVDGLAAGITAISAGFISVMAIQTGQYSAAALTLAVLGASCGFLRFNFSPAQIFMGDTGSMLLGYVLATASIIGVLKSPTTISFALPILVLGIPISDTVFAIIRRLKKKQAIMQADNDHVHHRLLDFGFTHKQVVLLIYAGSIVLGAIALTLSVFTGLQALILLFIVAAGISLTLVLLIKFRKSFFSYFL